MNDKDGPHVGASSAGGTGEPAHHVRREDGARQPVSESVAFFHGGERIDGWALNMSRGGLRAIVEIPLEADLEVEVAVGDDETRRPARIVWVQRERDGAIVGVSFLDVTHSSPPPPPPPSKP